jgi:hypothetical protein
MIKKCLVQVLVWPEIAFFVVLFMTSCSQPVHADENSVLYDRMQMVAEQDFEFTMVKGVISYEFVNHWKNEQLSLYKKQLKNKDLTHEEFKFLKESLEAIK